jgi:hypothetical protein
MLRNFLQQSCHLKDTVQTFLRGKRPLTPLIFAVVPALVRRVEKKQVGARYEGQTTKGMFKHPDFSFFRNSSVF